jgi:ATP-dependent Clp protease protease subunit
MTTPPAHPTAPFDDQLAFRLLHQRIVVIGGEIDDTVANRVCAQLLLLSAEDASADVAMYLNTPGGSVAAALAVYDTMRLLPNEVATVGFGVVAGGGQLVLTAGAQGKRYALPHARIRLPEHPEPVVHELLARHTSRTSEQVGAGSDRSFTATEAVAHGIVDRVVESVDDVRPSAHGRRAGL